MDRSSRFRWHMHATQHMHTEVTKTQLATANATDRGYQWRWHVHADQRISRHCAKTPAYLLCLFLSACGILLMYILGHTLKKHYLPYPGLTGCAVPSMGAQ